MWTITCYNGTVWKSSLSMISIEDVVNQFVKDTGLHQMDIKSITNNT